MTRGGRELGTTVRLAMLVFGFQLIAASLLLAGLGAYVRWEISAEAGEAAELLREDLLTVYARDGLPALAATIRARTAARVAPGPVILLADGAYRPLAGSLAAWPRGLRPGEAVDAEL